MKDRTILLMWASTLVTAVFGLNLYFKGPDSSVALAVVAAIVGISGYAVGRKTP